MVVYILELGVLTGPDREELLRVLYIYAQYREICIRCALFYWPVTFSDLLSVRRSATLGRMNFAPLFHVTSRGIEYCVCLYHQVLGKLKAYELRRLLRWSGALSPLRAVRCAVKFLGTFEIQWQLV